MKRSELTEFEIEEEGFKLRLSRQTANASAPIIQSIAPANLPQGSTAPAAAGESQPAAAKEDPNVSTIKSPMVGTFYSAASPESSSFTDVGKKISNDSIVCIIEAMKVMNEIQADFAGEIIDILEEDGSSVEYGQPLFKIRKN